MQTIYSIEQTTTGYTVRSLTTKPNGKVVKRLIGRRTDYEAAQALIDDQDA